MSEQWVNRRMPGGFFAILFLFCCHMIAQAQVNNLHFKHLGIADGLSQSSVYCLYQDTKGFIWIGTTDGLSRYDGYSFRHFKYDQQDSCSIGSNEPLSISEDNKGNLLIGTSVGMDWYDCKTEKFYRVSLRNGGPNDFGYAKIIRKDSRGNYWVGTFKGLMQYDPATHTLRPVDLGPEAGHRSVYAIAEDKDHLLWIGAGSRVVRYNPRTHHIQPAPEALTQQPTFGKSSVHVIRHDSTGNVWVGTERNGLFLWNRHTQQCSNYDANSRPNPMSSDMVRAIHFHNNDAWIGTRNGLYVINSEHKITRYYGVDKHDPASLSGNSVLCFLQDNAGSTWIGTFAGGISIEHPGNNNFSYIGERIGNQPGLNFKVISRILEDEDRNLWIATEGGGVNYYDRSSQTFRYIHVNPSSQHLINQETIKAIQLDTQHNLWIGTLEGLFRYNRTANTITPVPLKEKPNGMSDELVYGLIQDTSGLWIGTKGGLFHRSPLGTITRYRHNNNDSTSIISNDINALYQDHRGGIWIGTELGLSYLPKGQQRFVNYLNEYARVFNKNAILCIFEDNNYNIWIGTRGGGLKLFDPQRKNIYTLDTRMGLSGNIIHGIVQDHQGNLWISFNQSIGRISLRRPHPPFKQEDVTVTNYSVNNGLGSNEFLAAACRTRDGEIMFGGVNGIVAFHPDKLVNNTLRPPVALTGLLIKNNPVDIGAKGSPLKQSISYVDNITLTHDQAFFTLQFAALNYINSRTNQYAYRLEGLKGDTQWHYVGNQQSATYTNLDAGEYIFKVKAANNDGYWNETYTSLHVKVLPPLWKTWYAYLSYITVIIGLFYLFYSYSMKTSRLRHELQLQQLSQEKDRELTQRKLSFFTNISHEIKTPLTLILAPIEKLISLQQGNNKALNQLMLMQRNGERLLRLTDQLLDFRKFEAGNMNLRVSEGDLIHFLKEILLSFDAFVRHRNIRLSLDTPHDTLTAWFDHDKFEKILYNLLSNALKFTHPGGRVTVSASEQYTDKGRQILLHVADNGVGIAQQHLEKIFYPFHHYNDTGLPIAGTGIGLAFTKGLVTLHHGNIMVESTPATTNQSGHTCFTITFPADKDQYTTEECLPQLHPERITDTPAQKTPVSLTVGNEELDREGEEPQNREPRPVMLIVEDNPEMRTFISAHFEDQYTVHTAADGRQGWNIATSLLPDIIISDIMMPEMNGTELCRLLKKDTRTSHIPVILLTARTPLIFRMEGFETGADDYVTKPFSLALLQVRVHNLLNSRNILRERYSKDITLQPRNIAITGADEIFLEQVMQFIENNILEPSLNVEQMAREVNMSRITLYRKIKALTNQSTIEFIRSVRLKRAAQLLLRNEFTVNEVAYMVGFSDVDYFRKWFKKEFGSTPKEYAATHKQ